MTARERVIAAITFNNPDRIPVDLWTVPAVHFRHGRNVTKILKSHPIDFDHDLLLIAMDPERIDVRYRAGRYTDNWGCVWQNETPGYFAVPVEYPLDDWKKLETFKPPVDDVTVGIDENKKRDPNRFRLAIPGEFFHRVCWLRGMDKTFIDLMDGAAELYKLRDMLLEFLARRVSLMAGTDVDALFFQDDFGSQQQLLVPPDVWRSFIKPVYQELFEICGQAGKFVFFHSDGYIVEIIDDLIEMGVHALNSQVWCMGPEVLGDRFRGRITFWGEINRQDTIPDGSPDDIRAAAAKMKECLATPTGGLIGQSEVDGLTSLENVEALLTAWN